MLTRSASDLYLLWLPPAKVSFPFKWQKTDGNPASPGQGIVEAE